MNVQENPVQIQKVSRRFKSSVPLFLFHDGGGTILPYCLLGDMRRSVYGIANPHLYDGGKFEGGIEGMAARYAGLIRKTIPRGKVLLGGWSAGGSIALQVARCLETVPDLEVVGLIMIDTPFPEYPDWRPEDAPAVKFHIPHQPGQTAKSREAQQNATDAIIKALAEWELPLWEGTRSRRPPPTVFIRALQSVPGEAILEVDWFRDQAVLGWGKYHFDFIIAELTVMGDHFSIFTAEHLSNLEDKLLESCLLLEAADTCLRVSL